MWGVGGDIYVLSVQQGLRLPKTAGPQDWNKGSMKYHIKDFAFILQLIWSKIYSRNVKPSKVFIFKTLTACAHGLKSSLVLFLIRIVLSFQRKKFQILLDQKEYFCNSIIIDFTECPNMGETVQNGVCACPANQIAQNGACAGMTP